jgi:predicted nucleic acid-binding protein
VRVYFDPSVLVSLYVAEPASAAVRNFLLQNEVKIGLNPLQELELRNGILQKVMRKEISETTAVRSLRLLEDDFVTQIVEPKQVSWPPIYARALEISRRFASKQACRSFDLLHVAIAAVSEVKHFATFDTGQAQLARSAGLKLVEFEPSSGERA